MNSRRNKGDGASSFVEKGGKAELIIRDTEITSTTLFQTKRIDVTHKQQPFDI